MVPEEKIEFAGLPLFVYREIASHLHQVAGVKVDLIPYSSPEFDYNHSQISGLSISWINASSQGRQRAKQILAYYQTCYSV
jgi:hypothetical protein